MPIEVANISQVDDLKRVAQVGLIRAVFHHRIAVGDALKRRLRDHGIGLELAEGLGNDLLADSQNLVLCCERHFKVELIELSRRTVLPRILIAEARCDLIVFVKAGDHEQLLELLRCLRQGIELALVLSARDKEITRTLRRRCGQNRGLDIEESKVLHFAAQEGDDLRAENDVLMDLRVSQVEVAVLQAHLLTGIERLCRNKRQHLLRGSE